MTREERLNALEGAFKKTAHGLTEMEPTNDPNGFAAMVHALTDLRNAMSYETDEIRYTVATANDLPKEPYVEEPPHGEPEPVEEVEKVDRAELQKRISKARAEKGINPKELVSKYADKFSNVKDEDLPKLKADLEEALRNA